MLVLIPVENGPIAFGLSKPNKEQNFSMSKERSIFFGRILVALVEIMFVSNKLQPLELEMCGSS